MRNTLTENWVLKLLALVSALILWFFVMGEQRLERSYVVPLVLENVPRGMMVANEVPGQVEVRISGPRTMLMKLQADDVRISVDLRDLQPGLTSFKRLEERLNIAGPLRVTRISPAYVDVKLEPVATRMVPVKAALRGEPARGFILQTVRVNPAEVALEGAESEVAQVKEVWTTNIDIEGVRENLRLMRPLSYRGRYSAVRGAPTVAVEVMIGRDAQEDQR
ncbi:CdaR family protein [Desulfuromonas sp. CSMB_57]|jgi:YbbR domain-containing protein|uniref:CdaR family protein n=1 Tax=Desulfuromonas sp. CSMB_57 TaxID=2807629 RepID=UPI001CD40BBB|nr:CdaR family protein [Desulfuromonas sp. CSMB_57]